ncbi:MAG: hypothetical protein U5M51_03220 [Emticicia sp.]|nr:hypothetical protein [Emticicia sp.]
MTKEKINFEKCDKAFIENAFQIKRVELMPELESWLNTSVEIEPVINENLDFLKNLYKDRMDDVNEETLKMNFIAPVLNMVQFNGKNFSAFADEKLEAEFDDFILTGKADWFVAKGKYKPERPYLFLQEYSGTPPERPKRGNSDPDGQLLAEMLVVRQLNKQPNETLHGVVITGKFWSFVVLKNDEYSISPSYDSTQQADLLSIYQVLKVAKGFVEAKILAS